MSARTLPRRLLLGPGPSNVHPRVLAAQGQPLIGHLDPAFLTILDRVQSGLADLFGADLSRAVGDDETTFTGANLTRVVRSPRRST